MSSLIPLADIRLAADRIRERIHRTPMFTSRTLGEGTGTHFALKCECFQKAGCFKPRGALNIVLSLPESERARGLITVSAGNHAQAVAWAAREVGVPAVVVMPTGAPQSKLDAVRGYGAEVVLHDDRATLFDRLEAERAKRPMTFVHPFDDPVGLAGAGTVGLEIMADEPAADVVVIPAGGGGLLAGVASAVKQIKPDTRVIGVELEEGPGFGPALAAGKPVPAPRPPTIADGLTPPFVGARPLAIVRECVEMVTVREEEIREAMRMLVTRAKLYVEGAGAAATAALLARKVQGVAGARVVAIVSGGNIDPLRLVELFDSAVMVGRK